MTAFLTLNRLSVEETNQRLPLVERIVTDLVDTWERVAQKRGELEELRSSRWGQVMPDAACELEEELKRLIARVNSCVNEVEELGGEIEEFRRGIVRFDGEFQERSVYLSWIPGEAGVSYFYEKHESHLRRRPIG